MLEAVPQVHSAVVECAESSTASALLTEQPTIASSIDQDLPTIAAATATAAATAVTVEDATAVEWGAVAHAVVNALANPPPPPSQPISKYNQIQPIRSLPAQQQQQQQQHCTAQPRARIRQHFQPGAKARHYQAPRPNEVDLLAVNYMFRDAVKTRSAKSASTRLTCLNVCVHARVFVLDTDVLFFSTLIEGGR